MTSKETDLIRRAIELLHQLVPTEEPNGSDAPPRRCPALLFAQRYLERQTASDVTSAELWQFYREVAASGELEPLTKPAFQRALPGAMEAAFGVKKCHAIKRGRQTVRGFRGVGVREEACPATTLELAGDGQ
jgi:hypothetical protein